MHRKHQAVALAILRNIGQARVDGLPLVIQVDLLTVNEDLTCDIGAVGVAEDTHGQLCTARTLQTGEAHDLTLADIEKCDKSFQQKKKTGEQKNSATQQKRNQFQSFPQREYSKEDYSSLEKQLLRNVQA